MSLLTADSQSPLCGVTHSQSGRYPEQTSPLHSLRQPCEGSRHHCHPHQTATETEVPRHEAKGYLLTLFPFAAPSAWNTRPQLASPSPPHATSLRPNVTRREPFPEHLPLLLSFLALIPIPGAHISSVVFSVLLQQESPGGGLIRLLRIRCPRAGV